MKNTYKPLPDGIKPFHITPDDLINSDYQSFVDHSRNNYFDAYSESFQKRVTDSVGTKYFINVERYFLRDVNLGVEHLEFSCCFESSGEHVTIEIVPSKKNLKEVESFYEDLWTRFMFDYYENDYGNDKQELSHHEILKRHTPKKIL